MFQIWDLDCFEVHSLHYQWFRKLIVWSLWSWNIDPKKKCPIFGILIVLKFVLILHYPVILEIPETKFRRSHWSWDINWRDLNYFIIRILHCPVILEIPEKNRRSIAWSHGSWDIEKRKIMSQIRDLDCFEVHILHYPVILEIPEIEI